MHVHTIMSIHSIHIRPFHYHYNADLPQNFALLVLLVILEPQAILFTRSAQWSHLCKVYAPSRYTRTDSPPSSHTDTPSPYRGHTCPSRTLHPLARPRPDFSRRNRAKRWRSSEGKDGVYESRETTYRAHPSPSGRGSRVRRRSKATSPSALISA